MTRPGAKYAEQVAAILAALDCAVSIIDAAALASLNPNGGARDPRRKMGRGGRGGGMVRPCGAAQGGGQSRQAVRPGPAYVSYELV